MRTPGQEPQLKLQLEDSQLETMMRVKVTCLNYIGPKKREKSENRVASVWSYVMIEETYSTEWDKIVNSNIHHTKSLGFNSTGKWDSANIPFHSLMVSSST